MEAPETQDLSTGVPSLAGACETSETVAGDALAYLGFGGQGHVEVAYDFSDAGWLARR